MLYKKKVEPVVPSVEVLADRITARVMDAIEMHTISRMPITSTFLRDVVLGGIHNHNSEEDEKKKKAEREAAEQLKAQHDLDDPKARVAVYLYVPFAEKDEAKKLGARWNYKRRMWYIPKGTKISPFAKWLESTPAWVESMNTHSKRVIDPLEREDEDDDVDYDEEDDEDDVFVRTGCRKGKKKEVALVSTTGRWRRRQISPEVELGGCQSVVVKNGVVIEGPDRYIGYYASFDLAGLVTLSTTKPATIVSVGGGGSGGGGAHRSGGVAMPRGGSGGYKATCTIGFPTCKCYDCCGGYPSDYTGDH